MSKGTWRFWFLLLGIIVVALIAAVLGEHLEAVSVLGARAQRAYEGYSALFGLIAVSAALLALVFAIPSFIAWARSVFASSDMALAFEIADSLDSVPRKVQAAQGSVPRVETGSESFIVRVVAENKGDAPLKDALLNIYAPLHCTIEVLDDPSRQHYCAVLPVESNQDERLLGDPDFMIFSIGYDTFQPGVENMFHVKVIAPGPGSYRILAYVDGDWDTARRMDVEVGSTEVAMGIASSGRGPRPARGRKKTLDDVAER